MREISSLFHSFSVKPLTLFKNKIVLQIPKDKEWLLSGHCIRRSGYLYLYRVSYNKGEEMRKRILNIILICSDSAIVEKTSFLSFLSPFLIPFLSPSLHPSLPSFLFFWWGASNIPSLRIIIINWKQRIGLTLIFWQMGVYSSILCSTGVILILCGKLFVLNILWEPFLYAKNYEQRLGRRISG